MNKRSLTQSAGPPKGQSQQLKQCKTHSSNPACPFSWPKPDFFPIRPPKGVVLNRTYRHTIKKKYRGQNSKLMERGTCALLKFLPHHQNTRAVTSKAKQTCEQFCQTTPASKADATRAQRLESVEKTAAASPYSERLASSTACSSEENGATQRTGPKISSFHAAERVTLGPATTKTKMATHCYFSLIVAAP